MKIILIFSLFMAPLSALTQTSCQEQIETLMIAHSEELDQLTKDLYELEYQHHKTLDSMEHSYALNKVMQQQNSALEMQRSRRSSIGGFLIYGILAGLFFLTTVVFLILFILNYSRLKRLRN